MLDNVVRLLQKKQFISIKLLNKTNKQNWAAYTTISEVISFHSRHPERKDQQVEVTGGTHKKTQLIHYPQLLPKGCYPRVATCWLLPAGCYPRFATRGLLPEGCYPRVATCWLLPEGCYLLVITQGLLPEGCYPMVATRGLLPKVCYPMGCYPWVATHKLQPISCYPSNQ